MLWTCVCTTNLHCPRRATNQPSGRGIRSACGDRKHRGCAINADPFDCVGLIVGGSPLLADREFVGRCAHGEHGHRHVVMATSPPAPLPTLTLSQVQAWDTDHLETAATHWTATAGRWRDAFAAVSSGIDRPGGTAWEGASAEAASARSERDRVQVLGLADKLSDASSIARSGAAELTAAKTRALASVDNAQRAGFIVSEDLSVRDTLAVPSKPLRLVPRRAGPSLRGRHPGAVDDSRSDRSIRRVQAEHHYGGFHGLRSFGSRRSRRSRRLRRYLSHHMNRKCGVPAPPEAPIRTKWSAHSTGRRSAPDFDPCRPEIACSTAEMKSKDCYTSTPKGTMRIGQPLLFRGWATGEIWPITPSALHCRTQNR